MPFFHFSPSALRHYRFPVSLAVFLFPYVCSYAALYLPPFSSTSPFLHSLARYLDSSACPPIPCFPFFPLFPRPLSPRFPRAHRHSVASTGDACLFLLRLRLESSGILPLHFFAAHLLFLAGPHSVESILALSPVSSFHGTRGALSAPCRGKRTYPPARGNPLCRWQKAFRRNVTRCFLVFLFLGLSTMGVQKLLCSLNRPRVGWIEGEGGYSSVEASCEQREP